MTKQQLISLVADEANMTKVDAARAVDAVSSVITSAMKNGESITWTGFGTFEVRSRKERMGRNPQTGEPMMIAASRTPAFKAGKNLKEAVK